MIHGLDTGFLLAAEIVEHVEHAAARATLARLLAASDLIAIAPQVLAEFVHVATDPRRFAQPLDMTTARQIAEQWWTARDVVHVFPDDGAIRQFLAWLRQLSWVGSDCWIHFWLPLTQKQESNHSLRPTRPISGCSASSPASRQRHPRRVLDREVTLWLHVTPDVQFLQPEFGRADDATVAGVRVNVDF